MTEVVNIEIKEITWQETIPIRHKVLWPDKPPEFCCLPEDALGWHFGGYMDEQLVSVASVYLDQNSVRLRKFATLEAVQGQGIGSALLHYILDVIRQKEISCFWCDARESAVGFYHPFGLTPEGERFYKSGEAYFRMSLTF